MVILRTLSEAYDYIKKQDPDTALTPWALRLMVVSGEVPSIKAGRKYLIDMDGLFAYLSGRTNEKSIPEGAHALHPIPEKLHKHQN